MKRILWILILAGCMKGSLDREPPVIEILSPLADTIQAPCLFQVKVHDNLGIDSVWLYSKDSLLISARDTLVAAYLYEGRHSLIARARDVAGNVAARTLEVVVVEGERWIWVDGNPDDWRLELTKEDTLITDGKEWGYKDPEGDDTGDGDYTYPLNEIFHGTEADMVEFRILGVPDSERIFVLIKLAGFDSLWMPFISISFDLDHIPGSGNTDGGGFSELSISSENAWEYTMHVRSGELVLYDKDWNTVPSDSQVFFNPEEGIIELSISTSSWSASPWDKPVYLTVFSALEEFGHAREINEVASEWYGGGGTDGETDPDVYDLLFYPSSLQPEVLSGYTETSWATLPPEAAGEVEFDR